MDFKDQLIMRHPDLSTVPDLSLPEGYRVHTYEPSLKNRWTEIVISAFDEPYDFDDKTARPKWCPERMFFVEVDGVDIATATCYEHWDYPGEGFLHMVGTAKEGKGKGAGRIATQAVLIWLRDNGYKTCILSTDDFRLPALHVYYSLGFRPVMNRADMPERWKKVYENIGVDANPMDEQCTEL